MITVTAVPVEHEDLYALLVEKERALRQENQGTLHRRGPRKRGQDRWVHVRYKGSIRLQKCLGGIVVAELRSGTPSEEWQLLSSFVGFLIRHLREEIGTITLSLASVES
jgi:hypothetical protein